MKNVRNFLSVWLLILGSLSVSAQVMVEDTSTNEPFFKAKKFDSKGYVGFEMQVGQMLKTNAAVISGMNLNWVINHKYVVTARYHILSSQTNIREIVNPTGAGNIYLIHHFAGLGFSYILFHDKKFSFQPELTAGWCSAKFEYPAGTKNRNDYGAIIPAVYGTFNASKIFRFGVGLNYRAVFGKTFFGLKSTDLNGVSGVVFIRLGSF